MADAYEKKFMDGKKIFFREKQTMPAWVRILAGCALIFAIVMVTYTAISAGTLGLLATIPFALLFLFTMSSLRVAVTDETLNVQYGMLGPKITIDDIESATPTKYNFLESGGWGVRYSLFRRMWLYNVIGDKGRAVEVKYRKNGKSKGVLIGSQKAEELSAAIQRVQASDTSLDFGEGKQAREEIVESVSVETITENKN